ncbi:hypothetical protein Y032_0568g53 [Ancylostoma ceylanicum]|uniref:Nucleoside diphosphate kinase n=1 Tax=Ancylostoma ceylanicum TaxID=53326 RepID=A0A016WNT3_9BILA|nr:hypothetical protein Y032_0568g53 [Ancylostoma ceylanicum]
MAKVILRKRTQRLWLQNLNVRLNGMWSLMILKPDIVAHPMLLKATLRELLDAGIAIAGAAKVQLTREKAQQLYETHRDKFFFYRLVRHVTSGPIVAMRVQGDVRRILGSSRLYPLPVDGGFSTIRQRCALSDVRNVAHASDSEAAERELALFEPLPPSQALLDELLRN